MSIMYRSLRWADFVDCCSQFWGQHWEEVGMYTDVIPLGIDMNFYQALEGLDQLHCFVVCDGYQPVGYMLWIVKKHPRYISSLTGIADVFWLHPDYRGQGVGSGLFKFAEMTMKALGVQRVVATCKVEHDLTPMFEHLGWTHHEKLFCKLLED